MQTRFFSWGAIALVTTALAGCADSAADKQRYFESGNRFLAQEKYAEAIVQYRNAIKIDERFGEARAGLADAYAATGDAQKALREYIAAADLLPGHLDAQMKAATVLSMVGRLEDAQARVQLVLAKDARHVEAHILLGTIRAGLRDIPGAVAQVEEAIQVDPTRSSSYTNLGVLRLAQGDRDAARGAFDEALEADPRSVPAHLALSMLQLQVGETAKAEATLAAALQIDPAHALANRAMAALYLASNRAGEAERYLKAFAASAPSAQTTFALADYYVAMRRGPDAEAVLAPLTQQPATAADAQTRLGQIEYERDRRAAHARIDGVLVRFPEHPQALVLKARWLLAEGSYADALERAQAAVNAAPDSAAAHYLAGLIQTQLRDSPSAINSFNQVLVLNPRAAAAQIQLSRLQLARGAASEAVQLAGSALENAPSNPEARVTLAGGLIAQREFARAEQIVSELQKEYPNTAPVAALAGTLYMAKKDFPRARAAYERALQFDRRSYAAISGLVGMDMLEKKKDAARARVEAGLAEWPDDTRLLLLASRVWITIGQHAAAERALRRVIELTPADSTAYSMLGQLYIAQNRLTEARAEFDALAIREPRNVAIRTLAGMLSHSTNDIADAKKRYRDILEIGPNAAVAANNLAWILAEEGKDLDEALRLAQRAASEAPDRAEIQHTLGWIYYRKQLPSLAIPFFEQSVERAPDNATFHYHLGLAHARSGNVDDARRALASALKLRPDYPEARELQSTLRD